MNVVKVNKVLGHYEWFGRLSLSTVLNFSLKIFVNKRSTT